MTLSRPRELIVAVPPLRSQVNLARIVRAAGCCGVGQIVACGQGRIDARVARDALEHVKIRRPRTLMPVLTDFKREGYQIVGLEQTNASRPIAEYSFQRRTVLVVGHERHGLTDDLLQILDAAVEIPVYGMPYSFNVATATAIALYEFCRQFPEG